MQGLSSVLNIPTISGKLSGLQGAQLTISNQDPLHKLLADPKTDPHLYVALMKGCNPEPMSEQAASIYAKQFMLNVLTILKGSDSALKERLKRLLLPLLTSGRDGATSKIIAKYLTANTSFINREIHRVEGERKALVNPSKSVVAA